MIDVKLDFQERKLQIEKYLSFVWIADHRISISNLDSISSSKISINDTTELNMALYLNNNSYQIDLTLAKILKSNSILLFYNLIEGTINSVMNEYFAALNATGASYKELKPPIKKIWLKYKHRSFGVGAKKKDEYIFNAIENILEDAVQIQPKEIRDSELGTRMIYNFEAYSKETNSKDISGNLDARKIKGIFDLYGLPEITRNCDSMLKVKNKRNSLAHGNETFTEVGSNFSIDDLFKMKIEITNFLEELIQNVETFIINEDFKIASE
ncbi:MAE_28990/MAE_18760 family HEPN-like nuclease [uncultured Aquimarina sp.]|uniref:MAE_28990/MAE_18760 family HEPN-like nuclease n=1 Tax=uncultured Aquimarina sp. TaxID=575652 RepID=UPI002637DE1F|nr:MAE_28990/MAE_18760 family HEPN-like nuclease [uncultured Aquimarina sp.]